MGWNSRLEKENVLDIKNLVSSADTLETMDKFFMKYSLTKRKYDKFYDYTHEL